MYPFKIKKILIPVDFSGTGIKVLDQAILMAKKAKAEIILLTVLEGPFGNHGSDYIGISISNSEEYETMIVNEADRLMTALEKKLTEKGVTKVSFLIEKGTPYKKILSVAKDIQADIIIMGTQGISGFREFVIGSNTFRVVSEATCPVLSIQKHTKEVKLTQILLPFRDKPHSREGVDYAVSIAKMHGATLNIVGISYDPASAEVKKIPLEAEQIKNIAEMEGVHCTVKTVHGDYVSKLIFSQAERVNADLIVVMSDLDKMAISEYIIGPVIQQLVNHSKIPVLTIHPTINPAVIEGAPVDEVDWAF
jgi:nucleotide-binding universal stress UspA family protein